MVSEQLEIGTLLEAKRPLCSIRGGRCSQMRCNETTRGATPPLAMAALGLSKPYHKAENGFHTSPETQENSGFTKADLSIHELTWNKGVLFWGELFWGIGQGGLLMPCW